MNNSSPATAALLLSTTRATTALSASTTAAEENMQSFSHYPAHYCSAPSSPANCVSPDNMTADSMSEKKQQQATLEQETGAQLYEQDRTVIPTDARIASLLSSDLQASSSSSSSGFYSCAAASNEGAPACYSSFSFDPMDHSFDEWEPVYQRITRHPEEIRNHRQPWYSCSNQSSQHQKFSTTTTPSVSSTSHGLNDGNNSMHSACLRYPPTRIIRAMVDYDAMVQQLVQRQQQQQQQQQVYFSSVPAALQQNDKGETPLHIASYSASEEVQCILVETFPQAATIEDCNGDLPLHYAARSGATPRLMEIFLQSYPEAIQRPNHRGATPIYLLPRSYLEVESLEEIQEEDTEDYEDDWNLLVLFLRYSYFSVEQIQAEQTRQQPLDKYSTWIVHAAAACPALPKEVLAFICRMFPPSKTATAYDVLKGMTPLLLAVSAHEVSQSYPKEWNEIEDGFRVPVHPFETRSTHGNGINNEDEEENNLNNNNVDFGNHYDSNDDNESIAAPASGSALRVAADAEFLLRALEINAESNNIPAAATRNGQPNLPSSSSSSGAIEEDEGAEAVIQAIAPLDGQDGIIINQQRVNCNNSDMTSNNDEDDLEEREQERYNNNNDYQQQDERCGHNSSTSRGEHLAPTRAVASSADEVAETNYDDYDVDDDAATTMTNIDILLKWSPRSIYLTDQRHGRSPLAIALETGKSWTVIRRLVAASSRVLECRDHKTGCFLFQLAAAHSPDLDTVFTLTRAMPYFLALATTTTTSSATTSNESSKKSLCTTAITQKQQPLDSTITTAAKRKSLKRCQEDQTVACDDDGDEESFFALADLGTMSRKEKSQRFN